MSQFIQNIRILSTASGDESSGSETPVINTKKSSNSSREQRREWLRNIPNTYNVYVCPDSPPIIHRTPGAPGFDKHGSGHLNDLQLLDSGLAKVSIRESNECSPARKYGRIKARGPSKRRSYSMSETIATTSDVSGTESDSYNRYPNNSSCTRGHFSGGSGGGGGGGGNRQAHNRGHSRNNQNYNHRGGGNIGLNSNSSSCGSGSNNNHHQKSSVDWDRICVEEFIDEDFDFEGNLALFNKSAFYEMVDQREGNTSFGYTTDINNSSCISSTPPCFTEGPDGVGIPLFAISTQSSHSTITTTTLSKTVSSRSTSTTSSLSSSTTTTTILPATSMDSHHKDRTKLANNTPSSSTPFRNNKSQSQSVVYSPMNIIHSGDNDESNIVIHAQSRSNPTRRNSSSWWYTCTGQRVPICHLEQRQRLVHYLATGHLDNQTRDTLISSSLNTMNTFQGLTWGRLIESASRPLVDSIMMYLRQSNRTPQRVVHRPPARILIIPNGSNHLGAVLSLSVARQLSSLGACVLLYASTLSTKNNSSTIDKNDVDIVNDEYPVNNNTTNNNNNNSMSSIYRHELNLLTHLAPKPNQYGLDDDEDESYADNETDNDECNHDNAGEKQQQQHLLCGYHSKNTNLIQYYSIGDNNGGNIEQNDTDFDNISSCFGYSDSVVNASQYNIVDYSSVGRMWMSRMPGLKIIRRSSSITKLPSSIRIDLVIIGHSDDDNDNTENEINSFFKSNTNSLNNWLRNHNSIGGIIHLTPCQSMINSNDLLRNAQQFVWIVELGLPVLTAVPSSLSSTTTTSTAGSPTSSDPNEVTASNTSSATNTLSTGVSMPLTHLLIDIGLGRNIVRRLTGDLNLLPPYGLFDMGPMIPLRSADQHTTPSTVVSMAR
uniref:DFDF domain-containing protein n=1 Tax=Trichobilharzia regenti TaxID=157069 RepID=A0AA85KEH7_TRIRE|nr:unnamed protein product [Trichobilharzia regenti]